MAIELPTTHLFYHPILRYLSASQSPVQRQVIIDAVAGILELTAEQRARLANDHIPSHAYRSGWSLSVLKKAGLLANPSRGHWSLTENGAEVLRSNPEALGERVIERINSQWWRKSEDKELELIAGPGQGTGLSASQRKAVELHAMAQAEKHLRAQGWELENTSANKPYDYIAKRNRESVIVEVKGTTGDGNSIMLTWREVEVQQEHHPKNALVVVHSIVLDSASDRPVATGGTVQAIAPWSINPDRLRAKVYQYLLKG